MRCIRYLAVGLFLCPPALAQQAAGTAQPPQREAVLDFSSQDGAAADSFYEWLEDNAGRTVRLSLRIVPRQEEDDPGYEISAGGETPSGDRLRCGAEDEVGLLDNSRSHFRVQFHHPTDFHHPTTIHVGERLRFIDQTILCTAESFGSQRHTPLHISGHFRVEAADIPTAREYVLFPARP